jgi:hypothetical protein
MVRQREKCCDLCESIAPVLFRVQIDATQLWRFVCQTCYDRVSQDNPHYHYGGTWKAKKRR